MLGPLLFLEAADGAVLLVKQHLAPAITDATQLVHKLFPHNLIPTEREMRVLVELEQKGFSSLTQVKPIFVPVQTAVESDLDAHHLRRIGGLIE